MADVLATGVFIGTGKPEPVSIGVSESDNQEIVDTPSVTLFVTPTDLTHDAARRVETYLTPGDAAALGQMLLDHAASVSRVIAEGGDTVDDYSG